MIGLSTIRNPFALLRLTRQRAHQFAAARTDPMDNHARARAQSILAGTCYRDGSRNPGTLTRAQAADVLRWACDPLARTPATGGH